MKDKKYMVNDGWDMNEKGTLKKLSAYALEGWLLESMDTLHFTLVKGEAKNIKYAMDYRPKETDKEAYLQVIAGSDWSYVCDDGGFYIFSAPQDAIDFHTDREPVKKQCVRRMLYVGVLLMLGILMMLMGLSMEKHIGSLFLSVVGGMMSGFFGVWLIGLLRKVIQRDYA